MKMIMMLNNWLQRGGSFSSGVVSTYLSRRQLSLTKRRSLPSLPLMPMNQNPSHRRFNLLHDGRRRKQLISSSDERSFSAESSDGDAPLRRRRKPSRLSNSTSNVDENATNEITNSTTSTAAADGGAFFSPIDTKTGELLTSDQYLNIATLSPWVPCPDVVSKRVFEIASASSTDIHVDLGCGDGRLNFMAVDSPSFNVGKSWGLDVDSNILMKCYERLGRRFVPNSSKGKNDGSAGKESRLEFVQADLIKVIEKQKELYQQQQQQQSGESAPTVLNNYDDNSNDLQTITNNISNSTIITMYFVDKALHQIQPYLSSILGGKHNVRVITIGYEMPNKDGWDPSWVERVLGLTIFRYDMENVTRFPSDWSIVHDGGESGETEKTDDPDLEDFLQQKRQEDMEELNRGLRIHHDEELDEFAHARAKTFGAQNVNSSFSTLILEEDDEDAWEDFDETEEPEDLMKEAQRKLVEERKASRGKMMAGVNERKRLSTTTAAAASKKPTWKKP